MRRRPLWRRLRPWLLLIVLVAIWAALEWREAEPRQVERVSQRFTVCGRGTSFACVHDGDSFRLGKRKIRIQHIDAPEIEGRCDEERQLAVRSRDRLTALLNQGPFTMSATSDRAFDQYGRELRIISRAGANGRSERIGDRLVEEGLAHRYVDHKTGWC